ncbi:MAG: hypothetical protein HPY71_12690 [Firmicutes bacterium]|nr:hypothetical protein [Bacillota bacterium]
MSLLQYIIERFGYFAIHFIEHMTINISCLATDLELEDVSEGDLYEALDWLTPQQARIEKKLAEQHLHEGRIVLYDVSFTYYEGNHCPLAQFGYNRDKKRGKRQIVFGLLLNQEGCPVSIDLFPGHTADPKTVAP